MHAASVDRSSRLSRALECIRHHGPDGCTTRDLQLWTNSMAPATDVSELRRNGYTITCEYEGSRNGRRIYRYRYTRGRETL